MQILFSLVGQRVGLFVTSLRSGWSDFLCLRYMFDIARISDKIALKVGWMANDKLERILKEL